MLFFNMQKSIGHECRIACRLTCYNMINCWLLLCISLFFVPLFQVLYLNLIREENCTEIQAIIQPGKLFFFSKIFVFFFFLHDLHDQWNRAVQQPD